MSDYNKPDEAILPRNAPNGAFTEPQNYFSNKVGGKNMKRVNKSRKICKHKFVKTGKKGTGRKCVKCEYRKMVRNITRKLSQ